MAHIFLWYLISSLLGIIAFPLSFRLLRALPDRGYAITRALGWLFWGYIFWLLTSFNLLANTRSVLMLSLVISGFAGIFFAYKINKDDLRQWWAKQRKYVLVVELLFLVSFAGWAIVRGTNPEAIGTEKPMELAFINGILSSPHFPPQDPWLSGYSISYYYFGYVLVAMLAKISGTSGGMAFNLGISLIFGLSSIGAFSLVYNILARSASSLTSQDTQNTGNKITLSLLGPIFVLLVSNLEGFLHVLHNKGFLWFRDETGQLVSIFWNWLDIKDLNLPPIEPFTWVPDRFWWWWRASRVVQDYDLAGNPKEIIDEFPFFSYLLADLHPHVLAMPFAFLAMTLAFQVLINTDRGHLDWFHWHINLRAYAWSSIIILPISLFFIRAGISQLKFMLAGLGILLLVFVIFAIGRIWNSLATHGIQILVRSDLGTIELGREIKLLPSEFWLSAIVLGSLAFLNTWDFPLYVALFVAAYSIGIVLSNQANLRDALMEFLWLSISLGVAGIILFLPFYLGFSSQVGGIIPNLIYVTRGAHLWVMFAPLIVPILLVLIILNKNQSHRRPSLIQGFSWTLAIIFGLWLLAMLLGAAIVSSGGLDPNISQLFQASIASPGVAVLFKEAILRRIESPGGWLTLLVMLGLSLSLFLSRLFKTPENLQADPSGGDDPKNPSIAFTLLLILFGILLVLGPEFFYLQDQFGWRMNTIFKFYFQAWLIWGIAATVCSAYLLMRLLRLANVLWRASLALLLSASLVYPVLSLLSKTGGFNTSNWTLDSSAYLETQSPDVLAAINWLKTAPPGILAEAVPQTGGSYSSHAIFSTQTGFPAVLGWFGHESQWRGGGELLGPRQNDLVTLYCSKNWVETQSVLEKYRIRYIIVGNLEREAYRAGGNYCPAGIFETKFQRYLKPVFQLGQTTIYEFPNLETW